MKINKAIIEDITQLKKWKTAIMNKIETAETNSCFAHHYKFLIYSM